MTIDTNVPFPTFPPAQPVSQGGSVTQALRTEHEAERLREEAFIKGHSLLYKPVTDPPKDADVKFMMQLLGDAFIGKIAPLEGNDQSTTLGHTIDFLERALKKMEGGDPSFQFLKGYEKIIAKLVEEYKEAEGIAFRIMLIALEGDKASKEARNRLIADYAKILQEQFSKKPGWFPGGWLDKSRGSHAVMLHIDTKKGMKIINTGSGIGTYHKSAKDVSVDPLTGQLKEEELFQEIVEVTGCRKDRIESVEFYQALLELNLCTFWDSSGIEAGAEELYEGVVSYLGGKIRHAEDPNADPTIYKKPQRSGTCAIKGITASLYYALSGGLDKVSWPAKSGVDCFKQLKFQWQLETLVEGAKKMFLTESDAAANSYEYLLLQDVCQNLARSAKKLAAKHLLTDEQLQTFEATILDIQKRLDASVPKQEEAAQTKQTRVSTGLNPGEITQLMTMIKPKEIKHHEQILAKPFDQPLSQEPGELAKGQKSLQDRFTPELSQLFQIKIPEKFASDELLQFMGDFTRSFQSASEHIKERYAHNTSSQDKAYQALLASRLSDVVSALPVPVNYGKDIWSDIPQEKVITCMEGISTLLKFCLKCQKNSTPDPEDTVMQYTLLAILDKLAKMLPETGLNEFSMNYYELLRAVRSNDFALTSVTMQENCLKLMKYFAPGFTIEETIKKTNRSEFDSHAPNLFSFKSCSKNIGYYSLFSMGLTKENINQSQTFRFFSKFLEQPEVVDKLRISQPAAVEKIDKIAALMASQADSGLLPKAVYLLQNAAANIVRKHGRSGVDWNDLDCSPRLDQEANPRTWRIRYRFGNSGFLGGEYPDIVKPSSSGDSEVEETGKGGLKYSRLTQNQIMQRHLAEHSKIQLREGSGIKKSKIYQLELEQFRELRMTAADPFDELNRMISFCAQHPHLLNDRIVQNMLLHSPFKLGRISSQLHDNPAYAGVLAKSFNNLLKHCREIKDLDSYSIVLQVGKQIGEFIADKKTDPPFPDFDALMWKDWILPGEAGKQPQEDLTDPNKLRMVLQLLLPESTRSVEQYANDSGLLLSVSKNYFAAIILSSLQSTPADDSLLLTLSKIDESVKKQLKDNPEFKNELLDFLFNMFEPGFKGNWQGTFPKYHDGKRSIDLTTGEIVTTKGSVQQKVPGRIVNHPFFKQVMKDPVKTCTSNGQAIIINQGLSSEVMVVEESKEIYFYRTIGGSRYLLREIPDCLTSNVPQIVNKTGILCWSKIDEENTLYIQEKGQFAYQVNFENTVNESRLKVTDILRLKDGKYWVPPKAVNQFYSDFEPDPNFVLSFANKEKTEVEELVLPRLGLEFEVKGKPGEKKFYLKQTPGFYLVENQFVDGVPEDIKTLQITNLSGERRLLVPRLKIKGEWSKEEGSVTLQLTQSIPLSQEKPCPWIEYKIKDGKLHTRQGDAKFFQVYLSVLDGKFDESRLLLQNCPRLQRLTDQELEVIKWVNEALGESRHPAAIALQLKLNCLVEENNLKYPASTGQKKWEIINPSELGKRLLSYRENQTNAPLHRLSEKEEKFLFALIEKKLVKEIDNLEKEGTSNSQAIKELRAQLFDFRQDTETRRKYLETGVGKLGRYRVANIKEIKPLKFVTLNDIFGKWDAWQPQPVNLSEKTILTEKGSVFESQYFDYYAAIKSCTDPERETLLKHLEFYKYVKGTPGQYIQSLIGVAKNPLSYPSIQALQDAKEKDAIHFSQFKRDRYAKALLSKLVPSRAGGHILSKISYLFKKISFSITLELGSVPSVRSLFFKKFKKEALAPLKKGEGAKGGEPLITTDKAFDEYFKGILGKYFDEKPAEPEKGAVLPALDASLVPDDPKYKLLKAKFEKEAAELEEYRKMQKPEPTYSLKIGADLTVAGQDLHKQAQDLQTLLKTEKTALLFQANRIPDTKTNRIPPTGAQALQKIEQYGLKKQVTWEELQKLMLSGDKQGIMARTHLSEEAVSKLMYGMADYHVQLSRLHQMKEVSSRLELYEKQKDPQKKALQLQHFVQSLQLVRYYEPTTGDMDKLFFECANHYMYRSMQIQKLEEISKNTSSEKLAVMPTGFGKTKAMIPTLNQEQTQKGHVVNVWPRGIEIPNTEDVQESTESSFLKQVDRFAFDRSTQFSLESLQFIYAELKKGKELGIALNVKSETLRALQLHCILGLHMMNQKKRTSSEEQEQITLMGKILRFLQQNSWATIDEAHQVLDPLDKLIYTLGSPTRLPENQVLFFESLFQELISDEIAPLLRIKENKQALTQDKDYKQAKELLIKRFTEKYKIENTQEFRDFMEGNIDMPPVIANHERKVELCLLQGMLNQVLKESIKSQVDEKFGLSKLHTAKCEYAIPFESSNTPKENELSPSEFKNPHETMVKTYLTYLHKGLSTLQIKKLIFHLQSVATKEVSLGISMADSETNIFFKKLLPDYDKVLLEMQGKDMKEFAEKLQLVLQQPDKQDIFKLVIFYYIREIIAPQIKLYSKTLVSSVQNFRTQFQSSLSLTATPQDVAAHGPNTSFIPMAGTSGQVTHLMLMKSEKVHIIEGQTPKQALAETLAIARKTKKVRAIADIAAEFKGLSNRGIAEKICDEYRGSDMQAVLFFDETVQNFMMMDVDTGLISDPRGDATSPEQRVTIYDQARTVGSDIKQAIDAVALLTVGKDTTKAAAGQGAGRMRQWHMGQGTEWVVPEAIAAQIAARQKEMNPPNLREPVTPADANAKPPPPTPMQLLLHFMENQANQEAEKNYQSQLLQMDNEIRQAIIDKILNVSLRHCEDDETLDAGKMAALYRQFESELMTADPLDPTVLYGAAMTEKTAKEALQIHYDKCMAKVQKCKFTKEERQALTQKLEKYRPKWDEMALPLTVRSGTQLGMECEVLQEVEIEAQIEVQAQTATAAFERTVQRWDNVDLFSAGWEKPMKLNPFLGRISGMFSKISGFAKKPSDSKTPPPIWARVVSVVLVGIGIIAGGFILIPIFLALQKVFRIINEKVDERRTLTFSAKCCTWRLQETMAIQSGEIGASKSFFSPQILVSNNFYAINVPKLMEARQIPLDAAEQKPIFEVMVIQDELPNGKKQIHLMVIDQNDSTQFRAKLRNDRALELAGGRKRKVAIYDLKNKIVAQGSNGFTPNELEDNPEFVRLLAEVKLLNGDLDYTEQELEHIRTKAGTMGVAALHKFFVNHVLPLHPTHYKLYPKTDIAKILGGLPKKNKQL